MSYIDIAIFILYMLAMLGVGVYFLKKNKGTEDYYVGGRNMNKWHIGLSVVATDVGGGFSIGLGGLGFIMGLSGSWMLFTGLLGAWLSGIFLIPRIFKLSQRVRLLTFPQVFKSLYNNKVAVVAAIITSIGYLGFTASQLLAGAKLATATFPVLNLHHALLILGVIAVVYTVMGGLKAVIYTDTIQWIILLVGLIFIGIPLGIVAVGGWGEVRNTLPDSFFSLSNITWVQLANWAITIIPIWFVGMTLYQRIYASRSEKEARQAWFIAGGFEWPVMAFMGVLLGLLSRVAFEQGMFTEWGFAAGEMPDAEMGLPIFLRNILPVGLMGLMMSAYFSAILSTADSCLMAASGATLTDLLHNVLKVKVNNELRYSQILTFVLGALALLIAWQMENVLELMLLSYSFMVSGLLVPILAGLFWSKSTPAAAFWAMIGGGALTVAMKSLDLTLPLGLDANFAGIGFSGILMLSISLLWPNKIRSHEITHPQKINAKNSSS